jgi:hypothetical protein
VQTKIALTTKDVAIAEKVQQWQARKAIDALAARGVLIQRTGPGYRMVPPELLPQIRAEMERLGYRKANSPEVA